ncbi:hypothetical protein Q1695_001893 [Nippostrongylus brasiliensis]|nr:hypothetical protein Q1695_001893 [Nippostrongylus brasiliensis]
MERKALRFVLGQLLRSAQRIIKGDAAAVREAVSIVGTVNESMVRSFSFLDPNGKHWSGLTKVRFEGERTLKQGDGCINLHPQKGNIHEITALEDGSFFFDILVPGYGDSIPCHYFEAPESLPRAGRECTLKEISCPSSYFCYTVPLEQIEEL